MNDVKHLRELILGLAILSPIGCQDQPSSSEPVRQAPTTAPRRAAEATGREADVVPQDADEGVEEEEGVAAELMRRTNALRKVKRSVNEATSHLSAAAREASFVATGVGQSKGDVVSEMMAWSTREDTADAQVRCLTLEQVGSFEQQTYEKESAEWMKDKRRREERAAKGGKSYQIQRMPPPPMKPPAVRDACPESLSTNARGYGGVSGPSWRLEGELGDPVSCCYAEPPKRKVRSFPRGIPKQAQPRSRGEWSKGRLFYVEDRATRAKTQGSNEWMGAGVEAPRGYAAEDLERAAHAWLEDALEEHASIAAFSRATLEMMALGAPSELLAEYQRASIDEIEHARACFSLVAALVGEDVSADRIAVEGPRSDLDVIIADVFWGGCVGESVAALGAQRALRGCEWEAARAALAEISGDEARHAALAWSTLSFLGQVMPERVRRVLGEVSRPARQVEVGGEVGEAWVALGRLTPAQEARAEADAWEHLISPMLDSLLQRA